MKALAVLENEKLGVIDLEKPENTTGDDVLVKVVYSGLCGSDFPRMFEHQAKFFPVVLGHEFSGVVEKVGEKVHKLAVGDKVSCIPLKPCFKCEACDEGNYSLCKNYGFIGSRENGGMEEYVKIPEINLQKLPEKFDLLQGAFFEPITVVLHGLGLLNKEVKGKKVGIIGVGTMGLLAVQCAKAYGAELVSAFDINEKNLEAAKELGADEVHNVAKKDIENEYDKYDIMIETSGANPSFVLILKLAAGKGELLYIGTPHSTLTFEYKDFELINRKELTIKGSWMNYSKPFPGKEWTEAVRLFDEGLVKIDKLVGATVSMDEFCERLEEIKGRKLGGKIMVKIGESE